MGQSDRCPSPIAYDPSPITYPHREEKNMQKPKILFMGTPEFAVPSLEALVGSGYPLVAAVTQPDRPKGRGRKAEPPPVKIAAERLGVPVLQPPRVRDPGFLDDFAQLSPDMVALVAFGQILPKEIIERPPLGCLNVHPSLLPKYRGAAPINWTLIKGEARTGVTIIRMSEQVDAGDILLQEEIGIGQDETAGELHDRLAVLGSRLLVRAVGDVVRGTVTASRQDDSRATLAPKLAREDGRIRWEADFREIVNLVRGLSPSPAAWTVLDGRVLKVFRAAGSAVAPGEFRPGEVAGAGGEGLKVAAKNGIVILKEVQLEGKKRMPASEFLRGYRIGPGTVLE